MIIAVIYATFTVGKRKSEKQEKKQNKTKQNKKSGLYGIRTLDLNVAYTTATIILRLILHSEVHIYDFHLFITSSSFFYGFITNQFNDPLPVGLLA